MNKTIIALFALFAISQAALRVPIADNVLTASNNGQITLTRTPSGYVVPVDFANGQSQSAPMLISLYSSGTLLSSSCSNMNKFYCAQYSTCSKNPQSTSVTFPYYTAFGNLASAFVTLDYTYWSLAQGAPAIIATSCTGYNNGAISFGAGVTGMIGLGSKGVAANNFKNLVNTFALYFNANAFRLQFNPNVNAIGKSQVAQLRTDENWILSKAVSMTISGGTMQLVNIGIMFDVNSDVIALPTSIFTNVVNALGQFGVRCPTASYIPNSAVDVSICSFNGNPASLGNILINVDGSANNVITLTPAMYAANPVGTTFKLNLRSISRNFSGNNFVTSLFDNNIILGNSVLGVYYTLFNTNSRTVTLYH